MYDGENRRARREDDSKEYYGTKKPSTARTPEAFTPTTFEQFVKNKLLPNFQWLGQEN